MTQLNLLEGNVRLSHSSANLLLGCEQRYWHYKVNSTDKDSDYIDDQKQFVIGKAFHFILEETMHRHPKDAGMKIGALLERCVQELNLEESDCALVHAMVLKYLRTIKDTTLKCVVVETEIGDDSVIGYVDAIMTDADGKWWIVDLKTAKSIWSTLKARIKRDRQLNLYAAYYKQIAKEHKLKMKDFAGCIYWVTTKSAAKQRASENYGEYVTRMAGLIRSELFVVTKDDLKFDEALSTHKRLVNRANELMRGEEPIKNYGYCDTYFKPCPYWSQCYGNNFTEEV